MGIFNFLNRSVKKALGAREQQNGTRGRTIERLRTRQGEVRGHRGSRSVSRAQPNYDQPHESGVAPFKERAANYLTTPEGVEIPRDEISEFLYEGKLLFVSSSNVAVLKFDAANQILMVQFHTGLPYAYSPVSIAEAEEFVGAASKGGEVWSILRVRGSSTRHKKVYARMSHSLTDTPSASGQYGGENPLG